MLPLLAAVPAVMMGAVGLVGGAAALAGGAMSLAGGVMAAGSTMAGIAADAAGGVIGAATSLTGGGKSAPEPQAEARTPADQSTSDEQGAKALPPGVKLNKNGVMIQDSGGPGGGRILPGQFDEEGQLKSMDERLGSVTADRSGASPVNQILDYVKVIAANTARTAMGIGALMQQSAASTAQDNIDDSKNKTQPKQGMISKVFGGLTDRMRKISGSLGGVAKFMLKGLGLAGLIYLFKTNEESITKAVAGIFKFFHDLAKTIKESDDPIGDLMKFMKDKLTDMGNSLVTMFKEFYKATVEPMLLNMMTYINDFIHGALFGHGDKKVTTAASNLSSATAELDALSQEVGPRDDSGFFGTKGLDNLGYLTQSMTGELQTSHTDSGHLLSNDQVTAEQRERITAASKKAYESMWNLSRGSEWQIQWTGMPMMSKGLTFFDWMKNLSVNSGLDYMGGTAISVLRNSKPIVAGNVIDRAYLSKENYNPEMLFGYSKNMSEYDIDMIKDYNRELTNLKHRDVGVAGNFLDGDTYAHIGAKLDFTTSSEAMADVRLKKAAIGGSEQTLPELLPDPDLQDDVNRKMGEKGSIFTHDTHLQKLLEPVSKAFANGSGNGTVIVDSSSNDNRMTKQGDTINMGLDVHHSDPTSRAFHQWYHA